MRETKTELPSVTTFIGRLKERNIGWKQMKKQRRSPLQMTNFEPMKTLKVLLFYLGQYCFKRSWIVEG